MLLRDADARDLTVVELRTDTERAGEELTLRHGRGLDDRLTPHRGGGTDGDVGHEHVLPVAGRLLKLDLFPVEGVENEARAGVVRDHREGGRTTQGVGGPVARLLRVRLNVLGVEDAQEVVALTVTVQNLVVLDERQAVQQLVVDGGLKLRLVGQHVAVRGLPVGDGPHGSLSRLEPEVRLGLQTEHVVGAVLTEAVHLTLGDGAAIRTGPLRDGLRVATPVVLDEAENAEVVDEVGRRTGNREQRPDSVGPLRTGDHRIELHGAEATRVDAVLESTGEHVLGLRQAVSAQRGHVLRLHLPCVVHGEATGLLELLEVLGAGEHLAQGLRLIEELTTGGVVEGVRTGAGAVVVQTEQVLQLGAQGLATEDRLDLVDLPQCALDRGVVVGLDLDVAVLDLDPVLDALLHEVPLLLQDSLKLLDTTGVGHLSLTSVMLRVGVRLPLGRFTWSAPSLTLGLRKLTLEDCGADCAHRSSRAAMIDLVSSTKPEDFSMNAFSCQPSGSKLSLPSAFARFSMCALARPLSFARPSAWMAFFRSDSFSMGKLPSGSA